jgi:uncharacterized membrane protein
MEIIEKHLGKIIGVIFGLIFASVAVKYGIIKAIFVTACIVGGFFLGKYLDERVEFRRFFGNIFKQ